MTKTIKVMGLEIDGNVYPKLYELGTSDFKRLELVLSVARDHCPGKTLSEVIQIVESAKPLVVMGRAIGVLDFPAIYCWRLQNPLDFERFFGETVATLWGGDRDSALKMMEEYFERGLKK